MTQPDILNEKCPDCNNVWGTHHKLLSVVGGAVQLGCYTKPVEQTPENQQNLVYLRFVLQAHADRTKAEKDLLAHKQKTELEKQAAEAELKRKFESKVETTVNQKLTEVVKELEVDHKKAIEDGEKTRFQMNASHEARVLDLTAQLRASEGSNRLLHQEKTDLEAKLAASEAKSTGLQSEITGLNLSLDDLKARHRGLKEKSLDIVRTLISVGTRVSVLEEKLEIVPKVDPKRIFKMVLGEDFDDDLIPVDDLRNDPTPVPAAAPKAEVATQAKEPVNGSSVHAVPRAVEMTPPEQPRIVVLGGSAPTKPPAVIVDDEHEVSNDDVVDEDDADDESSEHETCSAPTCSLRAKYSLNYMSKRNTQEQLNACVPNAHTKEFFVHLQSDAKGAPKTAGDVALLFEDINN